MQATYFLRFFGAFFRPKNRPVPETAIHDRGYRIRSAAVIRLQLPEKVSGHEFSAGWGLTAAGADSAAYAPPGSSPARRRV